MDALACVSGGVGVAHSPPGTGCHCHASTNVNQEGNLTTPLLKAIKGEISLAKEQEQSVAAAMPAETLGVSLLHRGDARIQMRR